MTGMEHAIEQVRQAMQDAMKTYGPFSGTDQAQHVYDYLHALGLLAPAPLTEIRAENLFGETHRRWATDWEPVDRAEGDGRADCGCADCHTGLFPIMHVCADCGSKRCPRAIHHANPCNGRADQ